MRWDEESHDIAAPLKGYRPVVMDIVPGVGRRFRIPVVQAEIDRRIAIYTRQVEQTGRIRWLPYRGTGG